MRFYWQKATVLSLLFGWFVPACFCPAAGHETVKISCPGQYKGYSKATGKHFKYSSHYLKMHDSVWIAADVFLPQHLSKGQKIPALLYLTRYVRTIRAKTPLNWLKDPIFGDTSEEEVRFFTSHGYACVLVDVRGTGASTGKRLMEFNTSEVLDGNEIVNWITDQTWSNGVVGCTGSSYVGTTALLLLSLHNPSVKACVARAAIFDLYDNIVMPNGLCPRPFINTWGTDIKALDANDFRPFSKDARLVLGIHPVAGDKGRKIWKQALELHKGNFDVIKGVEGIRFRNDEEKNGAVVGALDDFSVHKQRVSIASSAVPIYLIDGWYDAAIIKGCIDAWCNLPNVKKVLIGPWDHGPTGNASPFATSKKIIFDLNMEMLRFFDHYLKGLQNGIDNEHVFSYFTVGEEKWHDADRWPPEDCCKKDFYFSANGRLVSEKHSVIPGANTYRADYSVSSGKTSRWNSIISQSMLDATSYHNRIGIDEDLLTYTSDLLPNSVTITGTPVVHLFFSADSADATVFCYLEDVAPDSSVTYITEGLFRPLHRRLSENCDYSVLYPCHSYKSGDAEEYVPAKTVELDFDLLPISYRIQKGHQLRLSISAADKGNFDPPSPLPHHFVISEDILQPSSIELLFSKKTAE